MDLERDIVGSIVQDEAFQDLRLSSIIFPSSPLVSILQFIGIMISAICS